MFLAPSAIAFYKIPIDSAKRLVIGKWELEDIFTNLYAEGYGHFNEQYGGRECFFEITDKAETIDYHAEYTDEFRLLYDPPRSPEHAQEIWERFPPLH